MRNHKEKRLTNRRREATFETNNVNVPMLTVNNEYRRNVMIVKPKRCRSNKRAVAKKAGYRSGFEHEFAQNVGIPFEYETERLPYPVTLTRHYLPDFIMRKKDGTKMYLELKGRFTASDRTKMKCIRKCYPNMDIRMVFQMGTNRITKISKKTYMDWCKQNDIKAYDCHGRKPHLPEEWMNELLS